MKFTNESKKMVAAVLVLLASVVYAAVAGAEELVILFTSNTDGYVKPCG